MCVFVQSQRFMAKRKPNYMDLFKVVFCRPGVENGESASCPAVLFWCRPIADVVVQEERLTQPCDGRRGEEK